MTNGFHSTGSILSYRVGRETSFLNSNGQSKHKNAICPTKKQGRSEGGKIKVMNFSMPVFGKKRR
jgi:hypothetical protein